MRLFQPVPGQFDTPLGFRPQIPPEQVSKTWVKLYATAGLRLLTTEEQDGLLAAVQNLLIASPFIFEPRTRPSPDWVKISEGLDEAVDGWITANYILEVVAADDASDTYGALDLGGASIQFTCRTPFMLDATLRTGQRQTGEAVVQLAGEDLHLYAVSHLAYGLIQSRRRVDNLVFNGRAGGESQTEIVHPCLLNGTRALCHKSGPTTVDCKPGGQVSGSLLEQELGHEVPAGDVVMVGSSDFDGCQALHRLVTKGSGQGGACENDEPDCVAMDSVELPKFNGRYLAFSYFYDVLVEFIPTLTPSVADIRAAAKQVCSSDAATIALKHADYEPKNKEFLRRACQDISYILHLLGGYLKLPEDEPRIELVIR
mmetsp:Transcript_19220/g.53170  ORF Transcript_19220/g.53170 Transcript_19220/m.53170 type:complete len:371 (-) Transcript_19220:479-1591(-)